MIRAYHNTATTADTMLGMIFGYESTHTVALVFEIDTPDNMPADDEHADLTAAEFVWHLLNVGDDPDFGTPNPDAVAYRWRGNRSLSKGDVVEIDGRFYAAASFGWTRLDEAPIVSDLVPDGWPTSPIVTRWV